MGLGVTWDKALENSCPNAGFLESKICRTFCGPLQLRGMGVCVTENGPEVSVLALYLGDSGSGSCFTTNILCYNLFGPRSTKLCSCLPPVHF